MTPSAPAVSTTTGSTYDPGYFRSLRSSYKAQVMRLEPSTAIGIVVRRTRGLAPTAVEGAAERFRLTSREVEVTHLLLAGQTNDAIAASLGISSHTARHHTEHVLEKLDVHSRSAIAGVLLAD
jgi:DNA-binding CsgD family transcriptional regulator